MKPLTYLINCAPEGSAAEWHQAGEEFKDSEDVIAVIAYSKYQAQEKEIEALRKQVEILQRPLDDEIISRIIVLVKNVSDEELASNVFESVRNMTNWNKSTPAEYLALFDKTSTQKGTEHGTS